MSSRPLAFLVVALALRALASHADTSVAIASRPSKPSVATRTRFPLRLNQVEPEALERLPGVGPHLTAALIAARPIRNDADLLRVPGIGPRLLARIRPLIRYD